MDLPSSAGSTQLLNFRLGATSIPRVGSSRIKTADLSPASGPKSLLLIAAAQVLD